MNDTPTPPPNPASSNLVTLMRIPTRTTTTLLRLYTVLALLLTAYLTLNALAGSAVAGCAPGSGCDTVLNSEYSRLGNLPVSLPAFLLYFITLLCSFYLSPKNPPTIHRLIWAILIPIAYILLASVAYFSYIQIFILQTLCKYCIASHVLGFLTGITILARNQSNLAIRVGMHLDDPRPARFKPKAHLILLIIAAILFAPLPLIQAFFPPTMYQIQPSYLITQGTGKDRTVTYKVSPVVDLTFPIAILPHVGNVDAPVVLTELYDYTCPNCREMATDLRALMETDPERYVLVMLPTPLNANCNRLVTNTQPHAQDACDLANIAMAMWLSYPQYFPQLHNDLMRGPNPPSPMQAVQYALQYITQEQLDEALQNPLIKVQIESYVEVYAAIGGSLPTLFIGSSIMQGYPGRDEFIPRLLSETAFIQHISPDQLEPQHEHTAEQQPDTTPPPAPASEEATQPTENQDTQPQSNTMSPDEFYNYSSRYEQQTPQDNPITGCDGCPRETIMNQQKNAPATP